MVVCSIILYLVLKAQVYLMLYLDVIPLFFWLFSRYRNSDIIFKRVYAWLYFIFNVFVSLVFVAIFLRDYTSSYNSQKAAYNNRKTLNRTRYIDLMNQSKISIAVTVVLWATFFVINLYIFLCIKNFTKKLEAFRENLAAVLGE